MKKIYEGNFVDRSADVGVVVGFGGLGVFEFCFL